MAIADAFRRAAPLAAIASAAALLLEPWQALLAAAIVALVPVAWRAIVSRRFWLLAFFATALLLPPLPLPAGDTGPHASVLIAGLGLLAGMLRLNEWRFRMQAVDVSLVALAAAMTLSLAFALVYSGPAIAAASAARVALFGIGVYVYFASARGPARMSAEQAHAATRWLYWLALAAAAFGCIDFIYQLPAPAGFEPQFLWLDSGVYRRAQGLFYESSTLGNLCSFFLIVTAVSLADSRRRIAPAPVLCAGAVLFTAALLLSFSRASVLACLISLGVLAMIERRRWTHNRALVITMLLLALGVIVIANVVPEVSAGYWGRFRTVIDGIGETPDRVFSGRLESWQRIGSFIADRPASALTGVGYKTLPYTEHLGEPVIADNMYLSMLVETGVAGLAALAALNAAVLIVCWRALRRGSFHGKWLFCFWVGESLQMLSGDILTYWRLLPLYFWVLAQAVCDAEAAPRSPFDASSAARPVR